MSISYEQRTVAVHRCETDEDEWTTYSVVEADASLHWSGKFCEFCGVVLPTRMEEAK